MKYFKILLLSLLALIIILGVVAYALPSTLRIEKTIIIKASRELVFENVNDLRNWEKWFPLLNVDTAMEIKYFGNEKGEGAGFEWKSDKNRIGCGTLTIIASIPLDSIYAEIDFLNKGKGVTCYLFKDSDSGTLVCCDYEMKLGNNPVTRYMGLLIDRRLERDLQCGLDSLKKIVEDIYALSQLPFKESQIKPFYYVGIREKIKPSEIARRMNMNFKELMTYVEKNKLKMTNAPFSICYSFTKDEVDYEAGVPVENCKISTDKIKVKQLKISKVIIADYYGPYSGLGKEYEAIGKWIVDNKKKVSGAPLEMYITDPVTEKDTSKWLTKIYYPIE
jgi:effector-binding domain-containing protein